MARLDVCERTQEDVRRTGGSHCDTCGWQAQDHRAANAEIERLKAENARLRAELDRIAAQLMGEAP